MLLLSDNVDEDNLEKINKNNIQFLQKVASIFDERILKPNFHDLCHIVDNYRNFGPLYHYSGFNFEHINGILSRFTRGTKRLDFQIGKFLHLFDEVSLSQEEDFKNFSYLHKKQWKPKILIRSNIYLSGKSLDTDFAINSSKFINNPSKYSVYDRVTINRLKIATKNYCLKKVFSFYSFIHKKQNIFVEVIQIVHDKSNTVEDCLIICEVYNAISLDHYIFKKAQFVSKKFYYVNNFYTDFLPSCICKDMILCVPKPEMF